MDGANYFRQPTVLPAYDALADTCADAGQRQVEQATVQKAVNISPMSILRQKRLAEVAEANGDWLTALRAWRRAIKLGKNRFMVRPAMELNSPCRGGCFAIRHHH